MSNKYVVDVSSYNGYVNWAGLKNRGITGAIIKIIRKDLNRDKQFDNNYKALHGQKMPWGVYNYTYATTVAKAQSDMKLVCDILDKCDKTYFKYGVWFDVEDEVQKKLSKDTLAEIINAAQKVVESRGYTFGTYTGKSFYDSRIDTAKVTCKNWWIARYYNGYNQFKFNQVPDAGYKPTMPKDLVAWQYTSTFKTEGLMDNVKTDMSLLYRVPTAPVVEKKTEVKSVTVKIGSARIDEHGKVSGGSAGDQTGNEVGTQNWYLHSKGWYVLRAKDPKVAEKIAVAMERACANKNIGYDQRQRNTLYSLASKVGFDPGKVTTKCETDCSALVRVCLAYAGIKVNDFNTATEKQVILSTGRFEQMVDTIARSQDYMKRGDILVTKSKGHTVVVLSNGSKVNTNINGKTYSGTFPALPPRGYYQYGDGTHVLTNYLTQIKRMQEFLNWAIGAKLVVDGHYGDKTANAVKTFQKKVGIKADAAFGKDTLAKAKSFRR